MSINNQLREIRKKRLIFTITTGRSGTGYLAKLFSIVPGVASFHEPDPQFSDVMRLVQKDSNLALDFWLERKLPQIIKEPASVYIETSHFINKGFFEPLVTIGVIPDLIILTRPRRDVAMSLYYLDTIPGRTKPGLRYYLSPFDPCVLTLPGWETLHDYQLCFWYCLEIERRAKIYGHQFLANGALVAKTSLEDLRTFRGFYELLKELKFDLPGLATWTRFLLLRKNRINNKDNQKLFSKMIPKDIDALESEVLSLVQEARCNY